MSNQKALNFNQKVWEIVKGVPKGKVTTYGKIANKLQNQNPRQGRGSPQAAKLQISAQLVGWALHANRSNDVPCHRVVDRNGRLAPNFAFDGAKEQRRRLEVEGVRFLDELYVDLSKYLWK
jgi:methylated-DNA-protein-cysteine methyltransferase-like protein